MSNTFSIPIVNPPAHTVMQSMPSVHALRDEIVRNVQHVASQTNSLLKEKDRDAFFLLGQGALNTFPESIQSIIENVNALHSSLEEAMDANTELESEKAGLEKRLRDFDVQVNPAHSQELPYEQEDADTTWQVLANKQLEAE